MLDKDKDIRAQAMLKSIWESGLAPQTSQEACLEWIEYMFKHTVRIIENYAKTETLSLGAGEPPKIGLKTPVNGHLTDEKVAESLPPHKKEFPPSYNGLPIEETFAKIELITEKEYKPKKFRYGIKDSNGVWYSSFFKNHYQTAEEAKNSGKEVRILYEVGEYNGKPRFTIQSIGL